MKPMPRAPYGGISEYRKVGIQSSVESATPHRLIEMLMDGALEKILGGLYGSLDMEKGGDVARNLANLYDYMMRRLVDANIENDTAILDEVTRLMGEIREAWVAIRNHG